MPHVIANLDIGRPLQFKDIPGDDTYPISESEAKNELFCYECQHETRGRLNDLQPLTPSTGVFTSLILCDMEAPVYVCLEHVPFSRNEFECFTPEVQELLRAAQRARDGRGR